jgi:hypothetical protein
MIAARWIRLDCSGSRELRTTAVGLALAQQRGGVPVVLWASAAERFAFALVAPGKFAPGRTSRWAAWALAPAAAALRRLGVAATLEPGELRLHGRCVAHCEVASTGECAVVAVTGVAARLPARAALEQELRARLEAQYGWQFDHSWPSAAERAAIARWFRLGRTACRAAA